MNRFLKTVQGSLRGAYQRINAGGRFCQRRRASRHYASGQRAHFTFETNAESIRAPGGRHHARWTAKDHCEAARYRQGNHLFLDRYIRSSGPLFKHFKQYGTRYRFIPPGKFNKDPRHGRYRHIVSDLHVRLDHGCPDVHLLKYRVLLSLYKEKRKRRSRGRCFGSRFHLRAPTLPSNHVFIRSVCASAPVQHPVAAPPKPGNVRHPIASLAPFPSSAKYGLSRFASRAPLSASMRHMAPIDMLATMPGLGVARMFSSSSAKRGSYCFLAARNLNLLPTPQQLVHAITVLSRICLSLFPLSVRLRIKHLHACTPSTLFSSKAILWSLILLPISMLCATLAAYTESTPITGRRRIILMSSKDQEEVINNFLRGTSVGVVDVPEQIHYYHILRKMLGEESAELGTLLGGRVLINDWREQWVHQALYRLEDGLFKINGPAIAPPDLLIPCSQNPMEGDIKKHPYTVLLIDRPEMNAFSFGLPPNMDMPFDIKNGVICIFTGFLDHFLETLPSDAVTLQHAQQVTDEQTNQLSVLLSHELSHLVLGHTMETFAKEQRLIPQVQKMFTDVLRTVLFPVTSMLGPFVNDSLFVSTAELSKKMENGHHALSPQVSRCFSQILELEADLVSLRLLAAAGVDPREAITFWKKRLDMVAGQQTHEQATHVSTPQPSKVQLRVHPSGISHVNAPSHDGFSSHPGDATRLEAIKNELDRWQRGGSVALFSNV